MFEEFSVSVIKEKNNESAWEIEELYLTSMLVRLKMGLMSGP